MSRGVKERKRVTYLSHSGRDPFFLSLLMVCVEGPVQVRADGHDAPTVGPPQELGGELWLPAGPLLLSAGFLSFCFR